MPTSTDKYAALEAARQARDGNRGQAPQWWPTSAQGVFKARDRRKQRIETAVRVIRGRRAWANHPDNPRRSQ